MKFLVIATPKEIMFTLPPAMSRQLVEAQVAWINQQKQAGKILEHYWIPGWARAVVIREAESAEDVARAFSEMPLGGLMNSEVYPLADYDESMKGIIESLKRAEQLFPPPPR